jgi:hypothetical protein
VPERFQLSRVKAYRKPHGAIVVARPSRWGNPWKAGAPHPVHGWPMSRDEAAEVFGMAAGAADRRGMWVPCLPDSYPSVEEIRAELRGKDVACWCPLSVSCHGDHLLAVAAS